MRRQRGLTLALHMALLLGMLLVIGPFVYMVLTSLTTDNFSLPSPYKLMHSSKTIQNYIDAWNKNHFSRYFVNSIGISAVTMVLSLFLATLTAYGFARFSFPAKEPLFKLFLFSMFVPALLNIIPQFTILKTLHLVDTYPGLILLYAGTGVVGGTFFLRGFFERIPTELEESIVIDGGGKWTLYRSIYIPLSLPAIGTLGIFSFSGTWDEFIVALTLIKTESHRTLPIALQLFQGQYATYYGLFFAASMMALLPIILIFLIFQKQFVNPNMSEGSVKG
ncbi:carbohydrate ABC transporter permease [Cohnella fermenti]|uniref:Carbohydrate ABC transporter permease n=1 Tax=Cohnella fermenti TaxID=2565925 RepID=A0A4S4BIZ0_9BACL|nr:carbohydrate ABC transporter permease [Cohnella fermenti]THF74001.1 carbohydrate ABC transporter permease [Cohnella fermenti]